MKKLLATIAFLALVPLQAFAAIAAESYNPGTYNGSTQDISWTHTTASAGTIVVVALLQSDGTATDLSATVDYPSAGTAMSVASRFTSNNDVMGIFYALNVPAGAHVIHVLNNSGVNHNLEGSSANYTGVGALDVGNVGVSGVSQDSDNTITTVADNAWVVEAFNHSGWGNAWEGTGGAPLTVETYNTSDFTFLDDSNGSITPGGTTVHMKTHNGYSGSSGDRWWAALASFAPSGGGAVTPAPSPRPLVYAQWW